MEIEFATALYRLLSEGAPVDIDTAALIADTPAETAREVLRSWPAAFFDKADRVAGLWGLALNETPHRMRHARVELYA